MSRASTRSCARRGCGSCPPATPEHRRLERNLHDGAQARLVALALQLGHARRVAGKEPERVPELLDGALAELRTSLAELRELARGIHPAVLTEKGLEPALYALASRAPVPVTLDSDGNERLPEAVEVAAYFAVSEALTNVAKYARASRADVAVRRENGTLIVDVSDDGVGGADAAARLGAARARGPGRRARRHALGREPAGPRDARARRDPLHARPRPAAAVTAAAGSPRRPARRARGGTGSSSRARGTARPRRSARSAAGRASATAGRASPPRAAARGRGRRRPRRPTRPPGRRGRRRRARAGARPAAGALSDRRDDRGQAAPRARRARRCGSAPATAHLAQRDPPHAAVAEPQQDVAGREVGHPAVHQRRDGQRGALPRAVLEQPLRAERRVVDAREAEDAVDQAVEVAVERVGGEPAVRQAASRCSTRQAEAAAAERVDPGPA